MKELCKALVNINPARSLSADVERFLMRQELLEKIGHAQAEAAQCRDAKDRVGWLKLADLYHRQMERLGEAEIAPAAQVTRARHAA